MRSLTRTAGACVVPVVLAAGMAWGATVTHYRVSFGLTQDSSGDSDVVLRTFDLDGHPRWLVVNPTTLDTGIEPPDGRTVHRTTWNGVREAIRGTRYGAAIDSALRNRMPLHDAGILGASVPERGVVLTVDLCPSHRPLDRYLFDSLLVAFPPVERPIPVSVSVSGWWMLEHEHDLAWLRDRNRSSALSIVWVNHSYSHCYDWDLPDSLNFMLEPGTDVAREVLDNERLMIENGVRPSIFFRFPGLISNEKLFRRVVDFGLVPVASDAWLAKGQRARDGSIVLVHGNGNEEGGVERLLRLLHAKRDSIRSGDWRLHDLRRSLVASAPEGSE